MVLDICTDGNQNGAMGQDQGAGQRDGGGGGVGGGAGGERAAGNDPGSAGHRIPPTPGPAIGAAPAAAHATRLAQPVSPRDHTRGPATAPITLLEYGDFECPYCGLAAGVVRKLQARFGDDLRFVFRPNPRSHVFPHAEKAAEAAEAAGAQGKFWEMHDLLFANQGALEESDLVAYARRLGLDAPRFEDELRAGVYQARVHDLEVGGWSSHVISTPTFFVNGVRFDDRPDVETLGAALQNARVAASAAEAARTSRSASSSRDS